MALPKALRDKLSNLLKDGAELPKELDDGVFFENEGDFLATVEKKTKPKLTAAEQRASQAAKEARESAVAEIVERLGLTDPDQIEAIKDRLAEADGTRTEAEKLKADLAKLQKETAKALSAVTKERDELLGHRQTQMKREALTPHLAKIHPDFRDMVEENLMTKIAIVEGKVVGPEGKAPEVLVADMLAAKPSIKAPDFKGGAGTTPNGDKSRAGAGTAGTGDGGQSSNGQTGKPLSLGEALKAALTDQVAAAEQSQ